MFTFIIKYVVAFLQNYFCDFSSNLGSIYFILRKFKFRETLRKYYIVSRQVQFYTSKRLIRIKNFRKQKLTVGECFNGLIKKQFPYFVTALLIVFY